jgi:hypothetical protein
MEYVLKWNEDTIAQHNARFKELMEKYVEVEEEDEHDKHVSEEEVKETPAPEIDPLTAMVMEQEARETRKAELYLKYRKERARRKRGLTSETGNSTGEENDGIDRASVSTSLEYNVSVYVYPFVVLYLTLRSVLWIL